MKTPLWESSPGALFSLMLGNNATRSFVTWDLYTLVTSSGITLRYCSGDMDVNVPTQGVFSSKGVRIDYEASRPLAHWKVGLDVDTWQVVMEPRYRDDVSGTLVPDQIGSVAWMAAVTAGALSGAYMYVDRCYFQVTIDISALAGAPSPVGVLRMFAGRVSEVDVTRTSAVITASSHMELLNSQFPVNVFQAGCKNTLFDGVPNSFCTLNRFDFVVAAAAIGGSTQNTILASASPPGGSSGDFTLGSLQVTTGLNTGFKRTIRSWTPGTFILIIPLPYPVTAGDVFLFFPGCDKTQSTCKLYNNLPNFRGEPYIPVPEAAA